MSRMLQREFTAREFNRDPSAVARSAKEYGQVVVTNRGVPALIVTDANRTGLLPGTKGPSLLEVFAGPQGIDDDLVGEPEVAVIELRIPQ